MNKNDLRGFKQVFMFEFMTGVKKTGFKVFLAIICTLSFCYMPLMLIISNIKNSDDSGKNTQAISSIESVYIYDNSGLEIDFDSFIDNEVYKNVSFITDSEKSYDEAIDSFDKDTDIYSLIIKTEYDKQKGFDVYITRSPGSKIKDSELFDFEDAYVSFYREGVLKNLGVSEEDYEYLSKEFDVTVMKTDKEGNFFEDTGSISSGDYFVMLAGLMIVFMFINMSVGNVATSIATEKSSRVIEYLLTGTRPLALLSGKICARLLETLITTFAAYGCFFLSQLLCIIINAQNIVSSASSGSVVVVSSIWENITLSKLVITVLYFLAGLCLYSIIGALTGASVSKLDELQDAYKTFSFLLIICTYADMALIIMMLNMSGTEAFKNFIAICPFTGAFITPALILTGKISILTGLIALIVIVIAAVIIFILSSAVYESMLLFQGKRLKAKDVIKLMKKQVVV